ncbi:hypothetical protein ON010_g11349 [Phytophthora cinnamomi]|nr:hypothetical protein ON010_g11349 [Phytophthora cinnamomi]
MPEKAIVIWTCMPSCHRNFKPLTASKQARAFAPHRSGLLAQQARGGPDTGPRSSAIIEPISEHEAPVSAAPAGPRTKSMVKTLSELELLERKYASLVRKLMYASEFSILTAYAEVITPIVYYAQEATRLFDAAPARVRAGQIHDSRPDIDHLVGVLHDADFTRTLRHGLHFQVRMAQELDKW